MTRLRMPTAATAVVAVWFLAAMTLLAVPASARAAGRQAATLAAGRAICNAAVAHRETTLSALIAEVNAAPHVAEADKATLSADLRTAISGLQALKAAFDADPTLAELRPDCKRIVTGFYVYLFLVPQSLLVVAADRVQSAGAALASLAALIGQQIAAEAEAGKKVTSAQGDDNAITTSVAAAEQAGAGAASSILGLTAAGYPANRPTIESARASLGDAKSDLSAALSAADAALAALKAS